MQASVHWTSIYTQRLGPKVKLVGSTINCQPVWWRSDSSKELRQNPHVQSYVMATDQVTRMLSVCSSPYFSSIERAASQAESIVRCSLALRYLHFVLQASHAPWLA